jgi:hypothetical protein
MQPDNVNRFAILVFVNHFFVVTHEDSFRAALRSVSLVDLKARLPFGRRYAQYQNGDLPRRGLYGGLPYGHN